MVVDTAQQVSHAISVLIIFAGLFAIRRRRDQVFALSMWVVFGLLGCAYYVYILFFSEGSGRMLSAFLRNVQWSIVLAYIVGTFLLRAKGGDHD